MLLPTRLRRGLEWHGQVRLLTYQQVIRRRIQILESSVKPQRLATLLAVHVGATTRGWAMSDNDCALRSSSVGAVGRP